VEATEQKPLEDAALLREVSGWVTAAREAEAAGVGAIKRYLERR